MSDIPVRFDLRLPLNVVELHEACGCLWRVLPEVERRYACPRHKEPGNV